MAIKFRCTCGKLMQVHDEIAGKKVRCPECHAVLMVPGGSESVRPRAPSPPRGESREHVRSGSPAARPASSWDDPRQEREGTRRRAPQRERHGMAGWMKVVLVVLILGVLGGGGWLLYSLLGGRGAASGQLAMVPADGAGFATVKVADLWNSKALEKVRTEMGPGLEEKFKQEFGLSIADIDRVTVAIAEKDWDVDRRDFEPEMWIVIQTRVPMDRNRIVKSIDNAVERESRGKKYHVGNGGKAGLYFASDREVWIAPTKTLLPLIDGTRDIAKGGALVESIQLASSDSHNLVASFVLSDKLRQKLREEPGMPPQLEPIKEVMSAVLTLNGSDGELELKLRFSGDAVAKQGAELINGGLALLTLGMEPKGPPDEAALIASLQRVARNVKVAQSGSEVTVRVPGTTNVVAELAVPLINAVTRVRESAMRAQAANNLRELAIAMHAHHDLHHHLPTARFNKGLSWRVTILPFIGQEALYREFKLDEPWDSPHNSKLLERMPDQFKPVAGPPAKPGYTPYQVLAGEGMIFHSSRDVKSRLTTISDGSSNTFLIVESSNLVPWTSPQDIVYEPFRKTPMPPLGYQLPGDFLTAFGDGSVQWNSTRMDPSTFHDLANPRDGMPVDRDRFRTR